MSQPFIYLVAPSGNPNFGDEFIASSWLRYLAKTQPHTEVYLDCPHPGLAQVLFAGLHPKLRVTNTLWRAVADSASLAPRALKDRVTDLVKNIGSPQYDLGLLQLRKASSLHLLGGGHINGMWPQHYGLIAAMQAVREVSGARLFATGLGLMPFDVNGEVDADSLFNGFEYASARDAESASTFGLNSGIDDAFLGVGAELGRNTLAANSLCICIQNDTSDDGYLENAVAIARERIILAAEKGRSVHYFEAIPGSDRVAFEQLSDLIPEVNFVPFSEIWLNGLPVAASQEWLTTRFHFHLLAAAAGATGTVIEAKTGYYDVKHESVKSLGSGWKYAAAGDSPAPQTANTLQQNLPTLMARKMAEAAKLYPGPARAQGEDSLGKSLLRSVKRRLVA
ncbi:polysaccharide pyruvyl transferase family protein [Arthrobacter psychrochitiniphilus]|uniref:polysaccharide pyruvyl transferase family protein n=1 Tax=Arthrobacter psychrochitiniphilus TaxID=291045 RepID=UPI003F7C0108